MAKELWVDASGSENWDARKKLVTTALENGANVVLVEPGEEQKVLILGRIKVFERNSSKIFIRKIQSKEDEQDIVREGRKKEYVLVSASDWKIIPLENIIADLQKEKCRIITEVSSVEEAKTALETLEVGVAGVLVKNPVLVKKVKSLIDEVSALKLPLTAVEVTKIEQRGMGDRVCVDTASMFTLSEGMLVGSQSNGLFLVHSETLESEYVASRPFRVNAGAVHAYTIMPNGKTNYLSELKAGDEVLAVDSKGSSRVMTIGRCKIEKRPLLLIEAKKDKIKISTLVQNAETINMVDEKGRAVSVTKLKTGDRILAYLEEGGRHFGMRIKETIEEK
ncbi:MAG: 3-dehydroquinate synthase II [Candidatus Altiarchaeales archaeon]|nr:3-dehydroquinate synthase II [Candidatus Altiarchaeales archaeon]